MLNKLVVNAEIQHRALKLRIYPTEQQALQAGAFDEAENLTGNGQNVFTLSM